MQDEVFKNRPSIIFERLLLKNLFEDQFKNFLIK